jgi:hypothetical protein
MAVVALYGCGDDESIHQKSDLEYFPLQTGFYQIYTIDETIYSELDPPQEFSYELKTEVVDSFANLEGGFTYVIYRSTRATESDPWVFQESWSARTNTQYIVLIEGNVSYIRIALPAFKNKEWNGNALNSLEEDTYLIESKGKSYQLNGTLEFDDALVVNQENEVNNLFRDEREEVYARNVGLIYKKSIVLNYCDEVPCFGQQIINDGVEYLQVLKEYGQN